MSTFECIICNKSFRSKSKLNLHKNTHENEKKYQCDICDKRFLRVDGKRIHMRTHTGNEYNIYTYMHMYYIIL